MKQQPNPKKTTEPDNNADPNLLTFGGHLEVLRRMLFRIIAVVMVLAVAIFCFKDKTFELLLAPSQWDFVTYRYIERFLHRLGYNFTFCELPVIAFFLGKLNVVTASMLAQYRKYAFLVIMVVAAVITPPDLMTLVLVTIPLYLLYEVSILVLRRMEK